MSNKNSINGWISSDLFSPRQTSSKLGLLLWLNEKVLSLTWIITNYPLILWMGKIELRKNICLICLDLNDFSPQATEYLNLAYMWANGRFFPLLLIKKGGTIRCLSTFWYRQVTIHNNKQRKAHALTTWTLNYMFLLCRSFGGFEC